jgi:hypothetical protein
VRRARSQERRHQRGEHEGDDPEHASIQRATFTTTTTAKTVSKIGASTMTRIIPTPSIVDLELVGE